MCETITLTPRQFNELISALAPGVIIERFGSAIRYIFPNGAIYLKVNPLARVEFELIEKVVDSYLNVSPWEFDYQLGEITKAHRVSSSRMAAPAQPTEEEE